MRERNWIFFKYCCRTEALWQRFLLFVPLSHYDQHDFCLSHWDTATNKISICCTKTCHNVPKIKKINTKMAQKLPKKHTKFKNYMQTWLKSETCLSIFGTLLETYTNLVCIRDSVQQIKKNVCRSDSLLQTK